MVLYLMLLSVEMGIRDDFVRNLMVVKSEDGVVVGY